jgi:hypothetical protein
LAATRRFNVSDDNSIPSFFIPGIQQDEAESTFEDIIGRNKAGSTNPTGAKIFRLHFNHDGKQHVAEVGKKHPYYPNSPGSMVRLIIEQRSPMLYNVIATPADFLVGHSDTIRETKFSD